ncbi:MAG TPA: hypothetical protein VFC39_06970, partial [Acidobacteriaceae bacterium]|nr:hypothetical protein [Acidobacteriaceae bacterium]
AQTIHVIRQTLAPKTEFAIRHRLTPIPVRVTILQYSRARTAIPVPRKFFSAVSILVMFALA